MKGLTRKEQRFLSYIVKLYKAQHRKLVRASENLSDDYEAISVTNQLRYAGRHVIDAIRTSDPDRRKDELECAKHHLWRARYDDEEFELIYYTNTAKGYINWVDSDDDIVRKFIPDYDQLVENCELQFKRIASKQGLRKKTRTHGIITKDTVKACKDLIHRIDEQRELIITYRRMRKIVLPIVILWRILVFLYKSF